MIISACHRSSGKTTLAIGLSYLLSERGINIQTFKKGPDFIDPMWLSAASKNPCYNLDIFMMGRENVLSQFTKRSNGADISIIEGNMGLYDSMDTEGEDSTANLSRILKKPVVLVIDASRINRGIAPLILGYQRFEDTEIAGVILNRIGSVRHEEKLKNSIKNYCGIEVLGCIPRKDEIVIQERHLGLTTIVDKGKIEVIGEVIKNYVDVERIIEIGKEMKIEIRNWKLEIGNPKSQILNPKLKIGVARDKAFCFYYPDNIEALSENGADVIPFSPLSDKELPPCDALYLGGGFPELFINELRENKSIQKKICSLIEKGLPVYAECGGLIYLILLGAIKAELKINKRPVGHGYVILKTKKGNKWFNEEYIKGHEFHYSGIKNLNNVCFGYDVIRGYGINGANDGIIYKNILASYTHLHFLSLKNWPGEILKFINEKAP